MTWEMIGATGEWAAAIAVVASLLYLARQIKLANQQSKAAARYSFLSAYGLANATIGESKESASVFHRGLNNDELDPGERMQFILLLGQFLNTWNVMYDLHQEQQLPENQWYVVRTDMHSAFSTPGGKAFWQELGKFNCPQEFADFVDELIASDDKPFNLLGGSAGDA